MGEPTIHLFYLAASLTVLVGLAILCAVLFSSLLGARRRSTELRARLEAASAELERLQRSFARFVPGEVVERIVSTGISTDAEKKEVTVLFSDIVGFTSLAESLDPAVVVRILNGYFVRMSGAIGDHRGHVSKFIGDGLLALFGVLGPNPWQANDAAHAALAMRAELAGYNRELAAEGLPELSHGIGLHRGVAVAGLMGSAELMEFTVIGSNVNLASRVEELTRLYKVDILVTGEFRRELDPRFALRELPPVEIEGISGPVATFAVEAFRSG